MNETIKFLQEHGEEILFAITGLYELGVRIWPTNKNWSIIDKIIKVISFMVPNRSTKKTFVSTEGSEIKESSKHVIKMIVFFVLFSIGVNAQINQTVKGLISYNADSATFKSMVSTYNTAYPTVGALYYNEQHATPKFRVFQNGVWSDLVSSGGGGAFWPLAGAASTTANVTIDGLGDLHIEKTGGGWIEANSLGTEINFLGNAVLVDVSGVTIAGDLTGQGATFGNSVITTSSPSRAGLRIGSFAGNPASLSNGDIWYNSTTSKFRGRQAGVSVDLIGSSNTGADGSFLRNTTTNPAWSTLTIPSTISANSIFVANSANTLVEITPTGSQSIRRNAGNTAWEAFTPASGISNSAAVNEMAKSDGTNLVPSGVFSTTAGDLTFGTGLAGTTRTLRSESSGANASLILVPKGSSSIFLQPTTGSVEITNTGTTGTRIFGITSSGTAGSSLTFTSGTNNPLLEGGGGSSFTVKAFDASAGGNGLILKGGNATSGNNNGGNVTISGGALSGTGVNGYVLIQNLPTSCAGAPTGALANIAGVLNVCP